jgi:signal transduction histidine kinase
LKLIKAFLPSTIEIKYNIGNTCGSVMADAKQIHQVAMNLLTNTCHAMENEGGKLDITLKEVDLDLDDLKDLAMVPGSYVEILSNVVYGIRQRSCLFQYRQQTLLL